MTRLISLIILVCAIAATHAATFTDVTIEGTPYLTTAVLNELYYSYLSRGAMYVDPSPQEDTLSNRLDPEDSFYEGYVMSRALRLQDYRNKASYLWESGWIRELPANTFDSLDSLVYTNQVDYFVAAGMSSNGWRNATNYNPDVNNWRDFDDPMYIYRTNTIGSPFSSDIEPGDILGPWIIDDLQLAFDHARYKVDGSWRTVTLATNAYRGSGYDRQLSTAKTEAIDAFSLSSTTWGSIFVEGRLSYSTLHNNYRAELINSTGFMYDFTRYGSDNDGIRTNSILNYFGGEIHAYIYADKPYGSNSTFDDFGYNVAEDAYTHVATMPITQGTATNSLVFNEPFGDPSIQPAFPNGTPTTETNFLYRGFATGDRVLIYSINHPFTRAP